jgi:hypothetical protein
MQDRTKLLVHFRRLSDLLASAIRNGPDGSLDGKFADEHPHFVHHTCAFYLAGSLAYLEGEDGEYSWNSPSPQHTDFDSFTQAFPAPPRQCFRNRGVTRASMGSLADVRNAVTHHAGDISKIRRAKKANVVAELAAANLPGIVVTGTVVTLQAPFLDFVRVAGLAVRNYYGEF